MFSNGGAWEVLTQCEGNAFHCFLEAQRRTVLLLCCWLQPSNSWQSVPTHYWTLPQNRPRNWGRNILPVSNKPRTLIALRSQQSTRQALYSTLRINVTWDAFALTSVAVEKQLGWHILNVSP